MSREYEFVDAKRPLTINVTDEDIDWARVYGVPGNGRKCVLSRAVQREHKCFDIEVHRTVAYVRKTENSVPVRYQISQSAHDTLVAFDASGRNRPIKVTLKPPRHAISKKKLRSEKFKATRKKYQARRKVREERLKKGTMGERARRAYTRVDPLTLLGVRNGRGKRPPGMRKM
jgi:hypothetical protein